MSKKLMTSTFIGLAQRLNEEAAEYNIGSEKYTIVRQGPGNQSVIVTVTFSLSESNHFDDRKIFAVDLSLPGNQYETLIAMPFKTASDFIAWYDQYQQDITNLLLEEEG